MIYRCLLFFHVFVLAFSMQLRAAEELLLATPYVPRGEYNWIYVNQRVLQAPKGVTLMGYFELSPDANFAKDVIRGKKVSITTELEQDFYSLKSNTTYYARAKISYTLPGQSETIVTGRTLDFTTKAFGENLPEPKFDKISGLLRWQDFSPQVNPLPTKSGVVMIQWMSAEEPEKIHQTNAVWVPTGTQKFWPILQSKEPILPNDSIVWRYTVKYNDGDIVQSDVKVFTAPPYDTYNRENPCKNSPNGETLRITPDTTVVCTPLIEVGNVWTDGRNGELVCPEKYPYNYNYQKGFTFTIPKLNIPVGPFGSGVGVWVESSLVHVTKLPLLNDATPGTPSEPGFQKWNLINWSLQKNNAQLWIVCGTDKDKPKTDPPPYEKTINESITTWFDAATASKAKEEKAPEPSEPEKTPEEGTSTVDKESTKELSVCDKVKESYKDANEVKETLDPDKVCDGHPDMNKCVEQHKAIYEEALACF